MEPPEVPTEQLHEEIQEHAHESKQKWQSFVALTTAIVAALAAVGSLMAGKFETDAMLEQLKASDQWAYYQAKGIKGSVQSATIEVIQSSGKPVDSKLQETVDRYKNEQKDIKTQAESYEVQSKEDIEKHEKLASGVTMFQIAIAISAISILMKRKALFYGSLTFVAIGLFFLIPQLLASSKHEAETPSVEASH